jgi:predicted permease
MPIRFAKLIRRSAGGFGLDLRHTLRAMRRGPGYALSAVLCLALAMGVDATLFSFLDSMYFRRLPVPDADRVVRIHRDERFNPCTWAEYLNFRGSLRSLDTVAWFRTGAYADLDGVNQLVAIETVSANYGQILRLGTALGRWFTPEDDSPSAEPTIVISYRLWKSQLHGDPDVVGKRIATDLLSFRVIGVAPEGFQGVAPPIADAAWIAEASLLGLGIPANRMQVNLTARLTPAAIIDGARAEIQVLDSHLRAANRRDTRFRVPLRVDATSGFLWINGSRFFRPVLLLMSLACGMVFLIACVNVANLLLARAASRSRELAVRQALGASRARLFRAAFTEGLVLAAGGTVLGIVAGHLSGRLLESMLPSIPLAAYQGVTLGIDWRVLAFLGLAGLLSAVLFSLPPALSHGRGALLAGLNGRAALKAPRQRELYSLVQVALSLTLLISTGVLLHALGSAQSTDPGFATGHRLYAGLFAPRPAQAEADAALFSTLLERSRALPGVRNATLSSVYFGHETGGCAAASALEPPHKLSAGVVEPGYFDMMRIPIVKGRGFGSSGDTAGVAGVVVNETMGRTWWPGQDAIGKPLWLGCTPSERRMAQVIGIARDSRYGSLDQPAESFYYTSRRENPNADFLALIVETESNPYLWAKPLMQLVESTGPRLRIGEVRSLGEAVALSLWVLKWQAALLGSLGLLAVILAAIGLYGVMSYGVTQRTREIGIRMALGAQPDAIQQMVIGRGLRIAGVGIAAGLLLSACTVRLLRDYLYGLSPFDPIAFGAASLVWLAITILACRHPAQRAIRADPLRALQHE